jgi:ribosome-associated protein
MSRKPKDGYYKNGVFIVRGSAEDDTPTDASKSDLKDESHELQQLGIEIATLAAKTYKRLREEGVITERLHDELGMLKKTTAREGGRRQRQLIGKLMRGLPEESVEAIRDALQAQRKGSASETLALHVAENWRDKLIAEDSALQDFLSAASNADDVDLQQLRAIIRQARKDASTASADPAALSAAQAESLGAAPRQGRAYRDLFQIVKGAL